jgi:hypothetical protein
VSLVFAARIIFRSCGVIAGVVIMMCSSGTGSSSAARADEPENFVVTTETCHRCRDIDDGNWNFVTTNQLSIRGNDPVGPYAGSWPAEKFGFINDWYPQSVRKTTLCGTLDEFHFYNPWYSGDEADWNNMFLPDPPYQYQVDEVAARHTPNSSDWPHASNGRYYVEAEVTPDESYYDNPWFPSTGVLPIASPLEGHKLCTYGPWVAEKVHSYKPEIHPSEQYWWRSEASGYLLAVQDDSNRFDRRSNYDFDGDATPSWWRAWSAVPRTATFDIAFSLSTLLGAATITITEDAVRENVLNDPVDADDGTIHAFEYNGRVLLRVVEGGFSDSHLKVEFVQYCRDSNDLEIRGYVRLTTKFGSDDRGGEGYHLLRFTEEPQPGRIGPHAAVISPAELAPVAVEPSADPKSIHPISVSGKPMIVATLKVNTVPTRRSSPQDLLVVARTVVGAEKIPQQKLGKPVRQTPVTIPITRPATLRLKLASGRLISFALPQVRPTPSIDATRALNTTPAPNMWPALALAAAGAVASTPAPIVRATRMTIKGTASYAPLVKGRLGREEESAYAAALTAALAKPTATSRVFGSKAPVRLKWSFAARDLTRNAAVPVVVNAFPKAGTIAVRTTRTGGKLAAAVTFPSKRAYALTARISMKDRFNLTGTAETTISNVVLASTNKQQFVRALLQTAAALVGTSDADLVRLAELEPSNADETIRDDRLERAQAVVAAARDVVRDRIVTLPELRVLVRAARLYAKT